MRLLSYKFIYDYKLTRKSVFGVRLCDHFTLPGLGTVVRAAAIVVNFSRGNSRKPVRLRLEGRGVQQQYYLTSRRHQLRDG